MTLMLVDAEQHGGFAPTGLFAKTARARVATQGLTHGTGPEAAP